MTQPPNEFPPPQPALHYYGAIEPPKLRGAAKGLAITAIVLGSLGLLGVCGLPQYFVDIGPPNPVLQEMRHDTGLFSFTIAATILGIIISAFLLFGGLKSLKLDPRGRTTLAYTSIVQAVMCVVGLVSGILYTLPKYQSMANHHPNDPVWRFATLGGQIGLGISVISLAFYCTVAYVFTRPQVKAQFEQTKLPGQP